MTVGVLANSMPLGMEPLQALDHERDVFRELASHRIGTVRPSAHHGEERS
jgi:hypothetical protein